MRINPTTLMFEDLSPEEALELSNQLENLVIHGHVDYENPLLKRWFNKDKKFHVGSTVLLAKLGLSLTRYYKKDANIK
jgi:hypothetical protein